jgi:flagella basal body P-ring formation protein FlgA
MIAQILLLVFAAAPQGAESRPASMPAAQAQQNAAQQNNAQQNAAPLTHTSIRLRAKATVRGAELCLSDVAEITGPRAAELGAIPMGYTPVPGRERVLTAELIASRAVARGIPRSEFLIYGRQCAVRVSFQSIAGRDLETRAFELLRSQLPANATIEVRGPLADWQLSEPRSAGLTEIQIAGDPRAVRGEGSVEFRAVCGDEQLGSIAVPLRVKYHSEVFVASAPLLKGDPADATRFERKRVEVTHVVGEPVADAALLNGRVLSRALPKDAVLIESDLARGPLFKKGDQTRLVVSRGSLRIEALVRLEADATVGALVPVTCLEFGKTLVARVGEDGSLSIDTAVKTK